MQSNILNIHDLILLLTSLECIFLAILLKALPAKRSEPRTILAGFFIITAINLTANVIIWNIKLRSLGINQTPIVLSWLVFSILLKGPLLYFYLVSLSHTVNFFHWKRLIHLLPAVFAVTVVNIFNINGETWQLTTKIFDTEKMAITLVWAMIKLLPVFYVLASIYTEYKLHQNLKQLYSGISITEFKLANVLLVGFCVHWLCSLISYVFSEALGLSVGDSLGIINNYLTVILVNGLFVFGIMNNRQLLNEFMVPAKHFTGDALGPKIAAIEKGIHETKLFLEPTINLERFSEQIGLRPRDTSIVLNTHYKISFLEFINLHRVEEAKRLLTRPEYQDQSIQNVIINSGFNSSSAFHRFFKRNEGITPTEYRKRAANKSLEHHWI